VTRSEELYRAEGYLIVCLVRGDATPSEHGVGDAEVVSRSM
jgi:hypothetical protein